MTARLKTLPESHRANATTIKWRRKILPFLACIMISEHANAHYIDSDFSGEIEIYTNVGLANLIGRLTNDLTGGIGGLSSCDSFRIKSGIWEVFYLGGPAPSCLLRPGDYDNLFNPLNCEDGSRPIIVNSCTGFKLRRDIMRQEANKEHDTSLTNQIDELKKELDAVVDATNAAYVALGQRILELPVAIAGDMNAVNLLGITLRENPEFQLVGDFDGDKRPDLWLLWTDPGIDGENKLFLGQADGTFSGPLNDPIPRTDINGGVTQAIAADLNHDGVDDLLAIWGWEDGAQSAGFNRFFAGSSTGFQPAKDALLPAADLKP